MQLRVFVTGASGFIGRSVCTALAGYNLLALTRRPQELKEPHRLIAGDLVQPELWLNDLKEFSPDVCIHLAWEGLPDYSVAACSRNFLAGLRLLQALRDIGCRRIVAVGTCWEYGTLTGCLNEESMPASTGVFATFKTALRLAGQTIFEPQGRHQIWARPFFVYGPGQRSTALIPSAYQALLEGRLPQINNPDDISDFVHVEDVADALAALATAKNARGIYNVGTGVGTRVRDVVNTLARVMGREDVCPDSREAGRGFWADTQRIQQDCEWKPRLSLEEGIRKTLDVWRAG